jgi:hypothetical protein
VDKSCTVADSFPELLDFFAVNIIPPWLSIFIYNLGDENRLAGDRSSETSSDRIDINKNRKSFRKRRLCLELDASSKEIRKLRLKRVM